MDVACMCTLTSVCTKVYCSSVSGDMDMDRDCALLPPGLLHYTTTSTLLLLYRTDE